MLTKREHIRKAVKKAYASSIIREEAPRPCFIFGEMRSGTNMLIRCLDRSFAVATYNENDPKAFDNYVLRESRKLRELMRIASAKIVVFKCIADSQRATELLSDFSTSRAIWIYRHYNDVVNSAIRKWSEHNDFLRLILDGSPAARWRKVNISKQMLELIREHYLRGISEESARALIWYMRNSFYYEQALDGEPRVKLVKYEDVVRSPKIMMRQVFEFLDIRFKDQYVDNVSAGSIGRESAPTIDPAIQELCETLYSRLRGDTDKRS